MRYLVLLLFPVLALGQGVVAGVDRSGATDPAGTWSFVSLGDEAGYIVENDADTLTHYARGTNDLTNFEYAYQQEATSADVRITCSIGTPVGVTENFTGAGVGLRETQAVSPEDDYAVHAWVAVNNGGQIASKVISGGAQQSSTIAATGEGWNDYVTVQYDASETTIETFWSSDGTNWTSIDSISKSLTFPVNAYVFATSHNLGEEVVFVTDNCVKSGTLVSGSAPTAREGIIYEVNLETGNTQGRDNPGPDNFNTCQVIRDTANDLTITGITNGNPAAITFTGPAGEPPLTDADGNVVAKGYTIAGVNGMTELDSEINGVTFRLWRGDNAPNCPTCSASNHYLYVDNLLDDYGAPTEGYGNGHAILGGVKFDTTSYGTYTNGGTLQAYNFQCTSNQYGEDGPSSGKLVRVEDGQTVNGDTITPRVGSYYLSTELNYKVPYDHFGAKYVTDCPNEPSCTWIGNGGKNKPRYTHLEPTGIVDWGVEYWVGISYRLDSTHWFDPLAPTDDRGRPQIFVIEPQASSTQIILRLGKWPGDNVCNHWVLVYYHSTTSTTEVNQTDVDLGSACDSNDKGVWTDFIIRFRLSDATAADGILQVWKASGAVDGSGNRTMTRVFSRVGQAVGLKRRTGYDMEIRPVHYIARWHADDSGSLDDRWIGLDEWRIGAAAQGAGYQDVHPTQQACTDNCP